MIEIGTEVEYQGSKVAWTGARGLAVLNGTQGASEFVEWFVDQNRPGGTQPLNGWYKRVDLKVVETPAQAQERARAERAVYPGELIEQWRTEAALIDNRTSRSSERAEILRRVANELEAALNAMGEANEKLDRAMKANPLTLDNGLMQALDDAVDAARQARD